MTWGNGSSGIQGVVSSSNSLVGSSKEDWVGNGSVIVLTNDNYVVNSLYWDDGNLIDVGAVTWGNGNTGIHGEVSVHNSLIGSSIKDVVGYPRVIALNNGNYVVASMGWDKGSINDAGAVTWGDGTIGTRGIVSSNNSLVGSTSDDRLGYNFSFCCYLGVIPLNNDNYVVVSPYWDNDSAINAGAVTWRNGSSGSSGVVDQHNSLVGSTSHDMIGETWGAIALASGNYVVASPAWDNDSTINAGAIT